MTPRRAFKDKKLIVASHNKGKVREIRELLAPYVLEVVSASELDLPEPEETGSTFIANAELKALAAAKAAGLPALADDSGYAVAALDGDPGIYSARWAGPEKDFQVAMERVELRLQAIGAKTHDQRRASFVCALCLAWPDGHMETFEGVVNGTAVWPPRGDKGFGYDPVFLPDGYDITFGEMSAEQKHGLGDGKGLSHRARAFIMLKNELFDGRQD
jgi:XTP/dITP diphosphohydrolase